MKTKKIKISVARQAIFDKYAHIKSSCGTQESLHAQLTENPIEKIQNLAKSHGIIWKNLEDTGNEILIKHFESEVKRDDRYYQRSLMRQKYSELFFDTFKEPLFKWYDAYIGFDITKFDSEIIMPYNDGTSMSQAIEAKHGKEIKDMILEFIKA